MTAYAAWCLASSAVVAWAALTLSSIARERLETVRQAWWNRVSGEEATQRDRLGYALSRAWVRLVQLYCYAAAAHYVALALRDSGVTSPWR